MADRNINSGNRNGVFSRHTQSVILKDGWQKKSELIDL